MADGDYLGSNVSRFVVTVKSLPVLYYGTVTANTPIKWAQSPDFTGGQIKTSSMHELDLSMDQAGLAVFLQSICDYSDRQVMNSIAVERVLIDIGRPVSVRW